MDRTDALGIKDFSSPPYNVLIGHLHPNGDRTAMMKTPLTLKEPSDPRNILDVHLNQELIAVSIPPITPCLRRFDTPAPPCHNSCATFAS